MKKIALQLTATRPPLALALVPAGSSEAAALAQIAPGPRGEAADAGLFFQVTNRLSELASNPAAQADAQQNIGLGVTDPLAYYILAKA